MRRIHLFEIEDYAWFPASLRDCLTRMLLVVHRLLKTTEHLTPLVQRALRESGSRKVIDLCSGSGGPMIDVVTQLRQQPQWADLELELTDLYPSKPGSDQHPRFVTFRADPVDAAKLPPDARGLRTMVCSFHHMRPETARRILEDAQRSRQPILIYEISDNTFPPPALFWIVLPINFLFALLVSIQVRPVTWRQVVFTWLIPILPICFAWDGAVSNVRTYGSSDFQQLLAGIPDSPYRWDFGKIDTRPAASFYSLGVPLAEDSAG